MKEKSRANSKMNMSRFIETAFISFVARNPFEFFRVSCPCEIHSPQEVLLTASLDLCFGIRKP